MKINLTLEVKQEYIVINAVENQQDKIIKQENIKKQAVKLLGGKCCICGYDRCIDALEFHHKDPSIKEFKLGSGNTMSWKEYKSEALKCMLVCSNCHKEIHYKLGYVYSKT